jgi:hypothetical protein
MRLRLTGDVRTARGDFEAARAFLSHSPDPHLGLAEVWMRQFDLDNAEAELNEAKRNGFQPGRREQKELADAYRARGERWLAEAKRARENAQMQDALRKANSDLGHSLELYNAVAPMFNGAQLAEAVSLERDKAARILAQGQAAELRNASDPPKETP